MIEKIKKFISNPAMTIFMWILMGACVVALFTNAVKNKDVPQIATLVLMVIDTVFLFIRYKK